MSLKNLRFFDIHIVGIVSSVSAQKLKCPSSARLELEKFQLELITTVFTVVVYLVFSLDFL